MIKKLLIRTIFVLAFSIILTGQVRAVNCSSTLSNGVAAINADCSFPGTADGVDYGSGAENTAVLKPNAGTITVAANQTLATGSIDLSGNGAIAIIDGGSIKLNTPIWMTDADADGYPSSTTQVVQPSQPLNGRRRSAMTTITSVDCDDTAAVKWQNLTGYADSDGDGHGSQNTANVCSGNSLPSGYIATGNDCDDGFYSVSNVCVPISYGDGHDGAVTVSASRNINTQVIASGRSYADGVAYAVSAIGQNTVTTTAAPNGIVSTDEVMVINLQGSSTQYSNVGKYQNFIVKSVSGTTITFASNVTATFGIGGNSNLNGQKIIVQRVPNYTNATVNAALSANAWDGTKGGVLAFKASGTLYVNSGTISMNGKGYRLGSYNVGGEAMCKNPGGGNTSWGVPGNGVCGGGAGGSSGGALSAGGAGGGSYGGAGGSGGYATGGNIRFSPGGGGGGGGGVGGIGIGGQIAGWATYGANGSTNGTSGAGGDGSTTGTGIGYGGGGGGGGKITLTGIYTSKLLMGSGGGGGGQGFYDYNGWGGQNGGGGGGIVMLAAQTITIGAANKVTANGNSGVSAITNNPGGAGGGGGGGTIKLVANTISLNTGGATATGGAGGAAAGTPGLATPGGGTGGNGGIGVQSPSRSGTTNPTYTTL